MPLTFAIVFWGARNLSSRKIKPGMVSRNSYTTSEGGFGYELGLPGRGLKLVSEKWGRGV